MGFKKQKSEDQLATFQKLKSQVSDIATKLGVRKEEKRSEIKQEWSDNVAKIRQLLGDGFPDDFLHNSVITQAIFMNSQGDLMNHQIEVCKRFYEADVLKQTLEESPIGNPPKAMTWEFDTSHNSIHHLYHMARFKRSMEKDVSESKRVIEWGGGYGNFCKLIASFPSSKLETYTIIDLPAISTLQWVYLSSVFGEESVNIVDDDNPVTEGKINLISSPNLEKVDSDYDLFISTWALSESPMEMHDFVDSREWFGANSLLMAIHQCGDHIPFMKESTNVGLLAKKFGARIEDVQVIPGKNYYIFK